MFNPINRIKNLNRDVAEREDSIIASTTRFVGSIEWLPTTSCEWTSASGTVAEFADNVNCDNNSRVVTGGIIDTSLGLRPEFGIQSGEQGIYSMQIRVVHSGTSTYNGGTTNYEFYLNDGVTDSIISQHYLNAAPSSNYSYRGATGMWHTWEEGSSFSNKTYKIKVRMLSGVSSGLYPASHGMKISIYYYPNSEILGAL